MGELYESLRRSAGLSPQSNTTSNQPQAARDNRQRSPSLYDQLRMSAGLEPSEPQPSPAIPDWLNPIETWANQTKRNIVDTLNERGEGKKWWEIPGAALQLAGEQVAEVGGLAGEAAQKFFGATGTAFERVAGAAAGAIQPSLEHDLAVLGVPGIDPEAAKRTSQETSELGKQGAIAGWHAGPRVWSEIAGPTADVAAMSFRHGMRSLGNAPVPGVHSGYNLEAEAKNITETARDIARIPQIITGWQGTSAEHPRPFWEAQQRIAAGEDPGKVLEEIPENPTAEFFGQTATDLSNFIGYAVGPALKAANLGRAELTVAKTAPEYADAAREVIEVALKSGTDIPAGQLTPLISEKAINSLRTTIQNESKAYRWYNLAQRTPRTMQALSGERVAQAVADIVGKTDDMIKTAMADIEVLSPSRGKNQIVDTMAAAIEKGLPEEEVRQAVFEKVLTTAPLDPTQLAPILGPDVATSRPVLEFALYTRDAFSGKKGFTTRGITKLLEGAKTRTDALVGLSEMYRKISKKYYPDFKPDKGVKAVSNIVMGVNSFMANLLMGLNPSWAIRNFLADTGIRTIDQGADAFSSWAYVHDVLNDFGTELVASERAFGPIGSVSADVKPFGIAKLAAGVEKFSGQATMATVIKKEMPVFMNSMLDEIPARYWNMLSPEQATVLRRRLLTVKRGESIIDTLQDVLGNGNAHVLPDELYGRLEAINPEAAQRVQSAVARGELQQLDEIETIVRDHARGVADNVGEMNKVATATQRTELLEDTLLERIIKLGEQDTSWSGHSERGKRIVATRKAQRPQEEEAMVNGLRSLKANEAIDKDTAFAVFEDALVEQIRIARSTAESVDTALEMTWREYNRLKQSGGRRVFDKEMDRLWKGFYKLADDAWTKFHNDVMQLWDETGRGIGIPATKRPPLEPIGRGQWPMAGMERSEILATIGKKTNDAFKGKSGQVSQQRLANSFNKYVGKKWTARQGLKNLTDEELKYWDEYLDAVIANGGKSPKEYPTFAERQAQMQLPTEEVVPAPEAVAAEVAPTVAEVPDDIAEIMAKAPEERLPIEQRLLDSYQQEQRMTPEAIAERNTLAQEEAAAAQTGTTAQEQAARMERMRKLERSEDDIMGEITANASKTADDITTTMAEVRQYAELNPHVQTPNEAAYKAWVEYAGREMIPQLNKAKTVIAKHATEVRDFIQHNYNDRMNIDVALGHLFPWSFWYTRTVPKFAYRFATRPELLGRYLRMMDKMEEANKDLPEYYRRQIVINGIPGIVDHPLLFNIRSTVDPLYQLWEDFTDRDREKTPVGKFMARVSDLGLNPFPPIIWGYALERWLTGHPEEAEAWMNYFAPVTRAAKYATALLGANEGQGYTAEPYMWEGLGDWLKGEGKLEDIKPFTGESKWDRNRTPKLLQEMVEAGQITPEEFAAAAYKQEGPIWEAGQAAAIKQRAPYALAGYLTAAGFTGRTPNDVEIERAGEEWYNLTQKIYSGETMTKDEVSKMFRDFEEKYPFYKYIRTSKRDMLGEMIEPTPSSSQVVGTAPPTVPTPNSATAGYYLRGRAEEYANDVLFRLPPGNPGRALREQYLDATLVQKWYDSDNSFRGWSSSEIERFMAGIEDMGMAVMIPTAEERALYEQVKGQMAAIDAQLAAKYGEDIFDISNAFPYNGTKEEKRIALQKTPYLPDFWDERRTMRSAAGLDPWYGSQKEEDPKYGQAKLLFGEDIWDKNSRYFEIRDKRGNAAAKEYAAINPVLRRLWDWLDAGERDTRISPVYSTYQYQPRSYVSGRANRRRGGAGKRSWYGTDTFPWWLYPEPWLGAGYWRM